MIVETIIGFHELYVMMFVPCIRDLTTYVEWMVSGSSHSDLQDCQLLLVEYFPSGVYVDPDHIKNEEEFGGPEVRTSSKNFLEKLMKITSKNHLSVINNLTCFNL